MDMFLEKVNGGTEADQETWLLEQLEADPVPVEGLVRFLRGIHEAGRERQAESWAELLQDGLVRAGDVTGALRVLGMRGGWARFDAGFRKRCEETVTAWFGEDRDKRALIEFAGFDKNLPSDECVRRLHVLLSLEPDLMCHDRTWGVGFIRRVDPFYKKVEIHFKRRRGHQMSFAYAAETLELIGDDHILALQHHQPDRVKELVKEDPTEVVRMTLRSFGPQTVVQLQEILVPDVVPESGWRRFWEAARKGLKADPHVEMSAKRSAPIALLEKAFAYDAGWFRTLGAERSIPEILSRLDEYLREEGAGNIDEEARAILCDRLAFSIKGASGQDQGMVARSLMLARRFGIEPAALNGSYEMDRLFEPSTFLDAARTLPARDFKAFVDFLAELDLERSVELLVGLIPTLPVAPLTEIMDALLRLGRENRCRTALKSLTDVKQTPLDVMAWISRNLDRIEAWGLGTRPIILNDMLSLLELSFGERRDRGYNTLVGQFEDPAWLQSMLGAMADDQRRNFLGRMKDTPAFEEMDRRSILGKIIKLYPALEAMMVTRPSVEGTGRPQGRLTSERSHAERQEQLRKLVHIDIPRNSKEIGVARSYGDLRENHEFKAAKEMQTLLLRREAELKEMLLEVKPTDFEGFPHDAAGIGTAVVLRHGDGTVERYVILGEWDRDEELGIISCTTRLAEALAGRRAGELVQVPSDGGEVEVRIESVSPLDDAIRDWIRIGMPREAAGNAP
jgi:transcription elongation GreA/GreB family factor